jgi:hypothetical protein
MTLHSGNLPAMAESERLQKCWMPWTGSSFAAEVVEPFDPCSRSGWLDPSNLDECHLVLDSSTYGSHSSIFGDAYPSGLA